MTKLNDIFKLKIYGFESLDLTIYGATDPK